MKNYGVHSNNTFGGRIYDGDCDVHTSMCDIAQRIVSDLKFDEQCRKNCIKRDKQYTMRKEDK